MQQGSEDVSRQSSLSPQAASPSGSPSPGPMYKDTDSAGLKPERADVETQHKAQRAVIVGTPAQVIDTEANKSNAGAAEGLGAVVS